MLFDNTIENIGRIRKLIEVCHRIGKRSRCHRNVQTGQQQAGKANPDADESTDPRFWRNVSITNGQGCYECEIDAITER